jgi:hypothetical protein
MNQRNNFIGLDGFVWFIAVVENRYDPLKLGRVQARIFGWHTDNKTEIPTSDLPWSQPIMPPNNSSSISTPKEGDMIIGFFTDGQSAQLPVFLGVLPGIPETSTDIGKGFSDQRNQQQLNVSPDKPVSRKIITNGIELVQENKSRYPRVLNEPTTSRLARNENTESTVNQFRKENIVQVDSTDGTTWSEPTPSYNSQYPFNSVLETESGHSLEMDDTPNNERISLSHRTGTTSEMYPSGTKLEKVVKDNYTIVHGSDFAYVNGKLELTVENVAKIRIKGKTTIEIDGDVDFKVAGDMNLSVAKNLNIKAANMNTEITGKNSLNVGSKDETIKGETHHRYDGDLYTHIGADTYNRNDFGLDYSCPSDPPRVSGEDCSEVNTSSEVKVPSPNVYSNPKESVPVEESIRNLDFSPIFYYADVAGDVPQTVKGTTYPVDPTDAKQPNVVVDTTNQPDLGGVCGLTAEETQKLMATIGARESGNNYKAVNSLGYSGKYQFGALALIDAGYVKKGTSNKNLADPNNWTGKNGIKSRDDWLNSSVIQEQEMYNLMTRNCKQMSKPGGAITSSSTHQEIAGNLTAAHLIGAGGQNLAVRNNAVKKDAFGTSSSSYYALGFNSLNSTKTS